VLIAGLQELTGVVGSEQLEGRDASGVCYFGAVNILVVGGYGPKSFQGYYP